MIKNKYPTTKPSLNLDFANTKSLDPRITFRRGTAGAYYDGVTHVKAEENLIKYSENFNDTESYWGEFRATLTGSQASPIDSTSAYELTQTETNTAGVLLVNTGEIKLKIGKQYASSVYVKAGSSNYFAISEEVSRDDPTGAPAFTYFDLSNGEVMVNHENHIASIQNVGNQWYRCSIMFTAKIEQDYIVLFYLDNGSSQSTISAPQVTAGSSIYLWGAQLEQRDSATAYTKTEGAPITKYQPKLMNASPDEARFDHDPITGESKGLLIEEQRTNLIRYSQQIEEQTTSSSDFKRWVISHTSNGLIDSNASIAPDGTLSASKFYAGSSLESPGLYQQLYYTDTTPEILTFSVFAKAGQPNRYLQLFSGSGDVDGNPFANFNLFNGTISRDDNSIASIEDHGNGWYRCIITFTTVSTSGIVINPVIYLIDHNAERGVQMTGDGYSGLYIWGAQLETGSFPTSYIKTTGADATRSADDASITGENFSSWYRQDEGSLYSEVNTLASSSGSRISMSDGTSDNRIFISNGIYPLYINKNGDIQVRETSSALVNVYSKRAVGLKKNDFALSIDGGDLLVDASGDLPFVDRLAFSTSHTSDNHVNGHIKKLAYYPQRLTNEQLQNLTK
jgi:hypothetical protein